VVNSQSGKGGIAIPLKQEFGLALLAGYRPLNSARLFRNFAENKPVVLSMQNHERFVRKQLYDRHHTLTTWVDTILAKR